MRQGLQDGEPHADLLGALGHGPAVLTHELVGIQPHLGPVVEQGEEWSQREGGHKDGDEAKLQDCKKASMLMQLMGQGC